MSEDTIKDVFMMRTVLTMTRRHLLYGMMGRCDVTGRMMQATVTV
jgi:hypothetical protein